jgi:O-antigen biosynthesis protein
MPEFDKFGGHLRFFHLLKILATRYHVSLFCISLVEGESRSASAGLDRYADSLRAVGVTVERIGLYQLLRTQRYDVILFEFYSSAVPYLTEVRIWQRQARVIVDSVDVHFRRLAAKQQVIAGDTDADETKRLKTAELSCYHAADAVVAVSEPDKLILLEEDKDLYIEVIPLIYAMPDRVKIDKVPKSLVFVGNFNHDPNADAMRYFCGDVFPRVLQREPDARLKIIGADPPPELKQLSSSRVEVLGHVADLRSHLLSSHISVAPIRYGAGLKVKIGEAMSYALPVVTSSVGADGFGFTAGEDVLIADTPQDFADAIVSLFADVELCDRIGRNGREFIRKHFSDEALTDVVFNAFDRIERCHIKKADIIETLRPKLRHNFDRYVAWRFRRCLPFN